MRKRKNGTVHSQASGSLVIIGGAEDRKDHMEILREVANRVGSGKLVVSTVASEFPKELWEEYRNAFKKLGVKKLAHFHVASHQDARHEKSISVFDGATAVFFSGGDQLKITTRIGGTAIADKLFDIYEEGGMIAGTSAGASMMGESMLLGKQDVESHKIGNWMMAPGLGLLKEMVIDQHFAQRERIGRLLGAIALNPGVLGIGIDEDTAIVVEGKEFNVTGSNAVYVIDGRGVSYSNATEADGDKTMSMHDVRLHVLSPGQGFDLETRRPSSRTEPTRHTPKSVKRERERMVGSEIGL